MAFTVELRKPTVDQTAGILGFYAEFEQATKVFEAWSNAQSPTARQIEALITCICFFVPDEMKQVTRERLLNEATIPDLMRIVKAFPKLKQA